MNRPLPRLTAREKDLLDAADLADLVAEHADDSRRIRSFGRYASGFVVVAFGLMAALRGNWDLLGETFIFSGVILAFFEFVSWRYGRLAKDLERGNGENERSAS